jgi:hypothetical protein
MCTTDERLYALASFSEPDAAAELTACADAARQMLNALQKIDYVAHTDYGPAACARIAEIARQAIQRSRID